MLKLKEFFNGDFENHAHRRTFFLPFFIKYIRRKLQLAKGKNSNVFLASQEPDAQSLVRIIWVYVPGQKWFHLGK